VQVKRSLFSSSTNIVEVWATKKAAEAKAKLFRSKVEVIMFPIQHAEEKPKAAEPLPKNCLTCHRLCSRTEENAKVCADCENYSKWCAAAKEPNAPR
jgi:hypothetical protein